jgi:uncharacterized protein (DUF1501 family)
MLTFREKFSAGGRLKRRSFMRVGTLGLGGMALGGFSLSDFAAMQAHASSSKSALHDKSVIFLFMQGGPSQFETFDPKMDAPSSVRSVTGEIATSLPGVTFGSTFEKLAQRAHLLSVVRSFVTGDGNHDIKPIVGKDTLRANLGSLYSRVANPMREGTAMPTNVALFPQAVQSSAGPPITDFGNFASAGELGSAFAPFVPGTGGGLQEDLKLNLPQSRLFDRRSLLESIDAAYRQIEAEAIRGTSHIQSQAFDALLHGVADAFDLDKEDPNVIAKYDTASLFSADRIDKKWNNHRHYADHGTSIGKLLLLARRLCERGCGFVTVTTSFVWDMHADINNAPMGEGMGYVGAPFDHAVAAFIDDVEARGLKDKILLVCCGEMGRTPNINKGGGRDHWGNLAPLLLYGGGLRMGQVIGQSTRDGGQPASNPVSMQDLIATIMHTLMDVGQVRFMDGVPKSVLDVLSRGMPIASLMSP